MEDLSKIIENRRLPVDIDVHPYLLDHCVEGNAVLPAVEAMQVLAASVKQLKPDAHVDRMLGARFDKFLYVRPGSKRIAAISDIAFHENGDITAKLLTKTKAKKTAITRIKEHASICFSQNERQIRHLPLDLASALEGIVFDIPADRIYSDLVPFGPAYRNITGILHISEDGAIANIRARLDSFDRGMPRLLGSPFPLDATFHAACVWGQRFARFVAFPVGFEKRVIFNRLCSGQNYIGRVIPVRTEPDLLVFDAWIYDSEGLLFEAVSGILMKDVSAGRMKPPEWVVAEGQGNRREGIVNGHHVLSLIELSTVMPFAENALSEIELKRFGKMGDKRKLSYLAARLACKRLARKLSGNDMDTPARAIITVRPDLVRPCCPLTNGSDPFLCAASHDNRFGVAVASRQRIGVDVERASQRVLKCQDMYMHQEEKALVEGSCLGKIESSLRVWSIKEAVCKALSTDLVDSWKRVLVADIGRDKSHARIDNKDGYVAFHGAIDEHLFTIIEMPVIVHKVS